MMEDSNEDNGEKCLYATFNHDSTCFCIGTNKGFRLYNSYPLKCLIKRDIEGGVGVIDILNRCNIFAFVGTGDNDRYQPNKVILWDENKSKAINELILIYPIKNIKFKREKIFLICENNVVVFDSDNYEKIDSIKTCSNKRGIFGISSDAKKNIISYPSTEIGKIIIKNYDEKKDGNYITLKINAHQSEIVSLGMNSDGSLVASASERGTLIKVFRVKDGAIIQELRRGTEAAEIYSIAFDFASSYIACSSNKGTIHIFNVKKEENTETQNQKSIFGTVVSFFGIQNEYLNSEWSFAQYRLTYKEGSIVTFSPDSSPSVIVLTYDGWYHQGAFDQKSGGECDTALENNFLNLDVKVEDD